ncbi:MULTISPECIES: metal-dependent hydrolase [unclassified Pseudodesulfovibrio]|uniref:metal-dependent hydrolase n=1 Tax=unclassified Pseudodesulfovibrio TaxID=2661612 RepID=UPI000FEBC39A|nr:MULTISPECIES: metal-dependent hydrolase [unclassified Pseudodesulfovibrio]MCJ2164272.1 metal-dependent hydrolase [Pseudodesulfovibrio sp. S3-i]RWU05105.1 metal-dependent hydrolase [Pseudodesulfovibrio sp. S3]
MEITWFGHSNFRIKAADATLFIDPFFVGNPSATAAYTDVKECNLILVTHDHTDHIGQTLELAIKHDAEVVAIFDVIQSLIALGLPEHLGVGMNIGGTVRRQGLDIKMVQAMHSSITGSATGFIITDPNGLCLYNSGDTGLFGDMELFGEFHDIDIAMLPIGGRFTMDAKQAAYACKLLGCKKLIPQHWGTWGILDQNTKAMAEQLALVAPDTELVEMEIGKPVRL